MNKKLQKKKLHLLNNEINASEVRLPEQGIIPLQDAIRLARNDEMDLILISPNAVPPVCKIMDYQKFLYEQVQKEKAKPKVLEMKEIKVGPNTSENDLEYRIKHMIEFLDKGHKVKISMQFRGREMAYVTKGEAIILKLMVAVENHGIAEALPKLEGKRMFATIRPKNKK